MASTFTNLLYHIIYSTKFRRNQISESLREELYRYIGGIIRDNSGVQLEIGGMPDHVHILAKFSPTIAVSEMLRLIKANSSKWVNDRGDQGERFAWQTGYAAFSVSESQVPSVRRYIQNQVKHHKSQSFRDEFIEILKRPCLGLAPQATRCRRSAAEACEVAVSFHSSGTHTLATKGIFSRNRLSREVRCAPTCDVALPGLGLLADDPFLGLAPQATRCRRSAAEAVEACDVPTRGCQPATKLG